MSDDEEIVYVKKQKTIHYGSLEATIEERMGQSRMEAESSGPSTSSGVIPEYFDIDAEV
jgi:hypothetical protein